ncbi:MAG: hypothetical protein FWF66_00495 [Candidatus Bathyarchaeota archaeon]|nr:hypothetical protein [Candidatus Termiticorpusculum sp.]MCL1969942.1 hypothetical protein [Candidatus Termiticorpusculum sp.]
MSDFYDTLGFDAHATIDSGYYDSFKVVPSLHLSLRKAICECNRNPVIAEIKRFPSTLGTTRECSRAVDVTEVAKAMEREGLRRYLC